MDADELRAEFPVLADRAYLNAGTCGPLPHAAVQATLEVLDHAAAEGRARGYMDLLLGLRDRLRAAYATVLAAETADIAITTCTSDGIVRVLADSVRPRTKLVACSHVSWVTGAVRPEGLAELDVPVLLDGAQGVGAVPTDVGALGCDFYAGSGQKWLCGPIGTGMLWMAPAWRERLAPLGTTYINLADAAAGLDAMPQPDARRHDAPAISAEVVAAAVAACDVLAAAGWDAVHPRAPSLAATLAERLAEAGRTVAPRGPTTLVSWEDDDPEATRDRLAAEGIVVRHLPGTPYLRASVGAWNDEDDLERLLAAI